MGKLRYRLGLIALGLGLGVGAYVLAAPWWGYLIGIVVFLIGLLSLSMDSPADRSGHGKTGDGSG